MTWVTLPNASTSRPATGTSCSVTWSALMAVPRGMSWVATTVGSSVGGAVGPPVGSVTLQGEQDADERDDREEHPHEQDQSIRALQSQVSRAVMCDRWHHCSTGKMPRDYTNGLGPLVGNSRIPRVPQGCAQGSLFAVPTHREPRPVPARTGHETDPPGASPAGRIGSTAEPVGPAVVDACSARRRCRRC